MKMVYRLTVLRPHGKVGKRYGQNVWSPFPYSITFHGRGMGWQIKGGWGGGVGGSQVWMQSWTSGQWRSIVPNHFKYMSGFPKYTSDWMWWITRERAYAAKHYSPSLFRDTKNPFLFNTVLEMLCKSSFIFRGKATIFIYQQRVWYLR
jgi:hypothetical protein